MRLRCNLSVKEVILVISGVAHFPFLCDVDVVHVVLLQQGRKGISFVKVDRLALYEWTNDADKTLFIRIHGDQTQPLQPLNRQHQELRRRRHAGRSFF